MSQRFVVRPKAEVDLQAAFDWYEDREEGIGRDFLEEVENSFVRIRERPFDPAVLYRDVRRVLVKRFPYGVFYVATEERIQVIAVVHHGRDPAVWQTRT